MSGAADIHVPRGLVIATVGNTPVEGFALETFVQGDDVWYVHDASTGRIVRGAAAALRVYADYIETYVDDRCGSVTRTLWDKEAKRARLDADTLEEGTRV